MKKNYELSNTYFADFMGGVVTNVFPDHSLYDMGKNRVQNKRYWSNLTMKYHSSWDWMFPVLNKLKVLQCNYTLNHQYCTIETWDGEFKMSVGGSTTLEATYECVLEYLKWREEHISEF